MAKITLVESEIYAALASKYGDNEFEIEFKENEPGWEARNGVKFGSLPKAGLNDVKVFLSADKLGVNCGVTNPNESFKARVKNGQ